ncbi:MAG: DUF2764 family protein [Bacteroidales bacterium]
MSKYYCLVAGLPEINIEDHKLPFTVKEFKEEIYEQLSATDRKLFDLFFLKYDNANLLKYLENKEAVLDDRGSLKAEQLELLIRALKEEDFSGLKDSITYLNTFLASFLAEQSLSEGVLWEDQLATLYYEYALKCSNNFVSRWFEFNLNVNNMLVASTARKFHFDAQNFIVGENEVARAIRSSSARDWGLTGTIDYLESVQRIAEEADVQERERKIDLLKWNWLEEQTFFHYFTVERLFAYLLKVEIIERWTSLNKEAGEKQLREMVTRLKSEVKMPEDFE